MAIEKKKPSMLERLKREAKRVNDVEESRGDFTRMFKPEKGDNLIRILPHWDVKKRSNGDELFFARRLVHYLPVTNREGGQYNAPLRCLKDEQEESCPACQVFSRLKKAQSKKANDFRPTERYLYNIIDYGAKGGEQKEPAVVVYAAPFSIHKEVMNWVEELGTEFWDLETGRDWKLKKTVDASKGARNGTSYKLIPKLQDSAVPKKLHPLLEKMANLDEMWAVYSEENILKALKLAGQEVDEDDEEEEDEDEPKRKAKPKAKQEEEEDEDEEDEEEEEDEVKPKSKSKPKAKAKVEDDEDEDDEEEDVRPKARAKPKAKIEEDEDEEDEVEEDVEEDEEEEEEEVKPKKTTSKSKPVATKKKSKGSDSDIDDELRSLGI